MTLPIDPFGSTGNPLIWTVRKNSGAAGVVIVNVIWLGPGGGAVTNIVSNVVVANAFDADWPSDSPVDSLEHPSNNAAAAIIADRHPPTNLFVLI